VARLHLIDVIFQYAEEKYRLDMSSASNLHQLNLALTRGAEKETFVFPKGPSGKVKLAPKRPRVSADTKEVRDFTPFWGELFNPLQNTQPPSKKVKTTEVTKAVPAKKAALGRSKTSANKTASTKKSVAAPKKAPATAKKAATVKKPLTKKTTSAKTEVKKASHFRVTRYAQSL
jgi:histone H1/5